LTQRLPSTRNDHVSLRPADFSFRLLDVLPIFPSVSRVAPIAYDLITVLPKLSFLDVVLADGRCVLDHFYIKPLPPALFRAR